MEVSSIVSQTFANIGVTLSDDEIAYFTSVYPIIRGMIDGLYAVEEARYENPALAFEAAPNLTGWP